MDVAEESALKVLIVEPEESDCLIVRCLLMRSPLSLRLEEADSLEDAIGRIEEQDYDCVLMGASQKDGDVLDFLARDWEGGIARLPVIVLLDQVDDALGGQMLDAGAKDFLAKTQLSYDSLMRSLRHVAHRHSLLVELQSTVADLDETATHDYLTGLHNREGLEHLLLEEATKDPPPDLPPVMMLMNCRGFNQVKESHGHAVAEEVLVHIAECLAGQVREGDVVARFGADDFVLLLPDTSIADAVLLGKAINEMVKETPVVLDSGNVPVTVGISVAQMPDQADNVSQAVDAAYLALSRTTRDSRDHVVVVDAVVNPEPSAGKGVDSWKEQLLGGDQLEVLGQAFLDLATGNKVLVELFIRGPAALNSPQLLFHVARELDILYEVDMMALKSCVQVARGFRPGLRVCMNIFPSTLVRVPQEEILEILKPLLDDRMVFLDVNSQWVTGEPDKLCEAVGFLRRRRINFALDNIGLGRSTLESLLLLNPGGLKTHPSFVQGIAGDASKQRVMRRLLGISKSMGSELVALGLSNEDDVHAVRELGVRFGQGYFLDPPMPVEQPG